MNAKQRDALNTIIEMFDGEDVGEQSYDELRADLLGHLGGSMREQGERMGVTYNTVYELANRKKRTPCIERLLLRVWQRLPENVRIPAIAGAAQAMREEVAE